MGPGLTSLISTDDLCPVVVEDRSMIGIIKLLNGHVKLQEQRIKALENQIIQMVQWTDYMRDHDAMLGRMDET
jgi:hypothetical protein